MQVPYPYTIQTNHATQFVMVDDCTLIFCLMNPDKSWSKEAGGGDCGGDTASTCSGRTISSSVLSVKEAAVKPKEVKKDSPAAKSSTSRPGGGGVSSYQSILQKYSKYNLPSASSPKLHRNSSDGQSCSPQLHRKVTEEKKDTSFDWLRAPVKQTAYTRVSQVTPFHNLSQQFSGKYKNVPLNLTFSSVTT